MVNHGPDNLEGPVSRTSEWWKRGEEEVRSQRAEVRGQTPESRSLTSDFRPLTNGSREDRPIRYELVERVRRDIAEGTYETPEKWEAALARLFRRLEID